MMASVLLGVAVSEAPWLRPVSALALVVLGGLLLLQALRVSFPSGRVCRWKALGCLWERFPGVAGLLIGLSPCPPLLLAATVIIGRSPLQGLLLAGAFFVATSLCLLPVAFLGHPRIRSWASRSAGAVALLAAPWFVAHGIALLAGGGSS
ncbi:MAG: urease accessory protein UreH domain-containing protein [Candidatus Zipacnadales bacterium]